MRHSEPGVLILESNEARNVISDDHEDWEKVPGTDKIVDHRRWEVSYTAIFRHTPSGRFYRFDWTRGATEQQDVQPYEYDEEVEVYEVVQKQVTQCIWVKVEYLPSRERLQCVTLTSLK